MAVTLTNYVQNKRVRVTLAQVNAGYELLPAIAGYAYRLLHWSVTAIGGAAATATSVDLIGTRSAAAVRLAVNAVSAMSENTRIADGHANAVILAAGASFTALDANTAITICTQSASEGNLATCTHVDVVLEYAFEAA
jgi:hypothetical protein